MNNLYNVRISFKGDNGFTFTLPGYGELTVYNGKDIYIKGLSVSGVELLRQLRPLLLEHTLNAKADGCYKVIDLISDRNNNSMNMFLQANVNSKPVVKSVADLKSDLVKTTGPIIEEEPVVVESNDIISNEEAKDLKESDVIDVKVPEVKVEKPTNKTNFSKSNKSNKSNKGLGMRKSLTKSKK